MKNKLFFTSLFTAASLFSEGTWVHPHDDIKQYSMHGNFQKGLATKSMGAKEFEVWRASVAVGSKTPLHVHETEEVFIVLKGKIRAVIGDQEFDCIAPATLICPANIPHQLINIGDEPTDQILVLGVDSKIRNMNGDEMKLPWRE
ncbi:MAG TPA: cupin domain-containing protein [Rhabdochlamydiaceae bacterium]|jgi:quercetin dioxygenase-like cupin family protein|nr:cupin domain-containing protein [Rhabdochlamydiaceae bacterium]